MFQTFPVDQNGAAGRGWVNRHARQTYCLSRLQEIYKEDGIIVTRLSFHSGTITAVPM